MSDIRNLPKISALIESIAPDFIFHFAAQSLVRVGYNTPAETWATNVQGTVNTLEAARHCGSKPVILVATTDKVYSNKTGVRYYSENDDLWGVDPYSASKVGTELVVDCWNNSYFQELGIKIASVRAGNVIGGGDWSCDRIVPDIARAYARDERLIIRNADAIRPWQHVLDPLYGYLTLAQKLSSCELGALETAFNFGPDPRYQFTVSTLVEEFTKYWSGSYVVQPDPLSKPEAKTLAISSDLAMAKLDWKPKWDFLTTIRETARWYQHVCKGYDAMTITQRQISEYLEIK